MNLVLLKTLDIDQDYVICIFQSKIKPELNQDFYCIIAIYRFAENAKDSSYDFAFRVLHLIELQRKALDRALDSKERRICALAYSYLTGREE